MSEPDDSFVSSRAQSRQDDARTLKQTLFPQELPTTISRRTVLSLLTGLAGVSLISCAAGPQPPDTNPFDPQPTEVPTNPLTITGLSTTAFNGLSPTLSFDLANTTFSKNPDDVLIINNSRIIPASDITISDTAIAVTTTLDEGPNHLIFAAADGQGTILFQEGIFWAGGELLTVTVKGVDGQPVENVQVTASLADDATVVQTLTTQNSQVQFEYVPNRSIVLMARGDNNSLGFQGVTGIVQETALQLTPINQPSPIDNNDFSKGTEGWEIGNAPVELIPAGEEEAITIPYRGSLYKLPLKKLAPPSLSPLAEKQHLLLHTFGEGAQTISRTFQPQEEDTRFVSVRYRFITSEVPGGYFGSRYNDYFSISIRGDKTKEIAHEINSMNGLGLGAFDVNGATQWRKVILPRSLDKNTGTATTLETIQVDIAVANVADDLYDSMIEIDIIEETKFSIDDAELHNIDGQALEFLSVGDHPYYGGKTQIHGTITLKGAEDDQVKNLALVIAQDQKTIAAALTVGAHSQLIGKPFGPEGELSILTPQLLFELPAKTSQELKINQNGELLLAIIAESARGEIAVKGIDNVEILVHYAGTNRIAPAGTADGNTPGGDDWVKPGVKQIAEKLADRLQYGDFSKMNGGYFPPHQNHKTGNDFEATFTGYDKRDAAVADTLIELANEIIQEVGSEHLTYIHVTFTPEFSDAIKNVTLTEGKQAKQVFLNRKGFEKHFSVRIEDVD